MHFQALQLHIQDISSFCDGQPFLSASLRWNLDTSHMSRCVSFGIAPKQAINTRGDAKQYATSASVAPGSCNFLNQSTFMDIFKLKQI